MLFENTFNKILESYDKKCQDLERRVSIEYGPSTEDLEADRRALAEARCESIDLIRELEEASRQVDFLNKSLALEICCDLPWQIIIAIVLAAISLIFGGSAAVTCGLILISLVVLLAESFWILYSIFSVRPGSAAYFVHANLGLHRSIKQGLDQTMGF